MLTIGSLFSGIGGLELGLEMAGLGPVLWQAEMDPFCRSVLARHWPHAKRLDDVRLVSTATAAPVDIVCGGFPCQDISGAGKRAGIDGERSGLWREFRRVLGDLRPRFAVVENVSALLGRGMDRVLGDLCELGYDAEWSTLRASDVGAPHRRERVFVVAYRTSEGRPAWAGLRGRSALGGGVADADRGHGDGVHERVQPRYLAPRPGAGGARSAPREGRQRGVVSPAALAHGDGGGREVLGVAQSAGVERARGGEPDGRRADGDLDVASRPLVRIRCDCGRSCVVRDGDPCSRCGQSRGGSITIWSAERSARWLRSRARWADRVAGHAVADAQGARLQRSDDGTARAGGTDAGRGHQVGNADVPRRSDAEDAGADRGDARAGGEAQGRGTAGRGQPERTDPVGDPAGGRRTARPEHASRLRKPRRASPVEQLGGADGRPLESLVGRVLDGLPGGVDRWPAGPGEPQADWEPSRVTTTSAGRPARLRALGNAVVPQCGRQVGRRLLEIARGQE